MSMAAAPSVPARLVPPMHYSNVPEIGLRYWVVISIASVFGCNMGDFVAGYLHLGHWLGLFPLALIFAALLVGERLTVKGGEAWYWAVVIVLRTAATNLADLGTHNFAWPYAWLITGLETALILLVLEVAPRLASKNTGLAKPSTDGWYWAALLTAGTLGTAIGDCVAEEFDFGAGPSTIGLGIATLLIVLMGRRSGWANKVAYWAAIVAVRAAGTTGGDYLAFRHGLNLGLLACTALTGAVFIGTIILWRTKPGSDRH